MEKDTSKNIKGYSLKKNQLKRWIYEHNHTQTFVAQKLHMSLQELKDKLNNRELFNEQQIRNLVYLLGAKNAFKVIYFPTLDEKRRVYKITFLHEEGER